MYKICCSCQEEKHISLFHKNKSCADGYSKACKVCRARETLKYNSKEGIRQKNLAQVKTWAEKNKGEYKRNQSEYSKLKRKYQSIVVCALKAKTDKFIEVLGCSSLEFQKHIESQFTDGMNWGNYGAEWCLDHIIPIREFDISKYNNVLLAFNYKNTRPLTPKENYSKIDRLPNGKLARHTSTAIQDNIWLCYNSV